MRFAPLVFVACFCFAATVQAQVPAKVLAEMEYLVGEWETEGTFEGKPSKGTYSAQWAPGKHCLILSGRTNAFEGTAVSGWDPSTNEIVETWYRADGVRVELRYAEFTAMTWKGTVEIRDAAGMTDKGTILLEKTKDGFSFSGKTSKGQNVVSQSRRIVAVASPGGTAAEPYRAWLDYFVGTWSYDSLVGQDGGGEVTFRYTPEKFAVRGEGRTASGMQSASLVAWQADRKVLVDTDCSANGNYSVIEYYEFGDREMKGRFAHLHTADGNLTDATIVVTKESEDQVTAVIKFKDPQGKASEKKSSFKRKLR